MSNEIQVVPRPYVCKALSTKILVDAHFLVLSISNHRANPKKGSFIHISKGRSEESTHTRRYSLGILCHWHLHLRLSPTAKSEAIPRSDFLSDGHVSLVHGSVAVKRRNKCPLSELSGYFEGNVWLGLQVASEGFFTHVLWGGGRRYPA